MDEKDPLEMLQKCVADMLAKATSNAAVYGISEERCYELTVIAIMHTLLRNPQVAFFGDDDEERCLIYLAQVFRMPMDELRRIYAAYVEWRSAEPGAFAMMLIPGLQSVH